MLRTPGDLRGVAAGLDASHVAAKAHIDVPSTLVEVSAARQTVLGTQAAVDASAGMITRRLHTILEACTEITLEYGNVCAPSSASTGAMSASDAFRIEAASVETAAGVIHPIYFDGERGIDVPGDGTVAGSTIVRSDPLVIALDKDDVIYVRTAIITAAGEHAPTIMGNTAQRASDKLLGVWTHAAPAFTTTELVDLAVATHPWDEASTPDWTPSIGPFAVLGKVAGAKRNVLIIGDSIMAVITGYLPDGASWLGKFCTDHGIRHTICARAGEMAEHAWTYNKRIPTMVADANIIVSCLGRNDANTTLAAFKTAMLAWWAQLLAARPDVPIYQTTISPHTSAANDADAGGSSTAILATINGWLRSCPAPLSGIIDFADLTMTARDSNRWKSGVTCYATDGLHPVASVGVVAIQDAIEADAARYLEMLAGEVPVATKTLVPVVSGTMSVVVPANDTYVGGFCEIPIPRGILRGFLIEVAAPGGTASGGTKTINYSVGTTANAGIDLLTDTEFDVMIKAGAQTGASVHGDTAGDNVPAYFSLEGGGKYFAAASHLHFNFIGKANTVTGVDQTITASVKIWAFVDVLP
jgi:lysophospholipase L1-like esterase